MTQSERSRIVYRTAVGAVATIGLLAGAGDALAGRRGNKQVKPAEVHNLQTPLGLQGRRGAGNNVVSPFSLVDKSRRKSDIQAEYGYDVNRDGVIADGSDPNLPSEYFPATEDRRDPRNTRKNKKPQLFTTAGDIGSSHAFVWNSSADVRSGNFPTIQILYSPQGRPVPDPNNPGSYLFDDAQAGVKIRIRAVPKKGGSPSAWSYSDAFALNNNTPPSMTIDDVVPNTTSVPTASDEVVEIVWTAFDNDSEDKNGNGVLDFLDLEDENGNGVLDAELVAVAFDYYRVPEGVDPKSLTTAELEAIIWQPCTRAEGFGDPDDGVPSAPEGVGRQNTFAWDSVTDVGTVRGTFILRAKPFDSKKESGDVVYFTDGFLLDNHTIFNHPNANADLPAGRVGTASVTLVPGLTRSDPLYEPPLQSILVTGGSAVADGPGTSYVAVVAANTETAETTSANAIPYVTLADARSYHSATLLDDGRVLIAGGFDASGNPLRSTEIYDPATHTVSPGPDMLTARAKHAARRLPNGDVLLVGGIGAGGNALAAAEVYHFTPFGEPTEPAQALPDLAVAQHSLHAVLLPDQKVLVTGGISQAGTAVQSAQVLDTLRDGDNDPTTKEPDWVTVGSMNEARKLASATALVQGHVLFAGGAASPSKATMELYNWQTEQFEPITVTMPDGGRADHADALLGNGWVLLAGGTTDPDNTGAALVAGADVFELGSRAPDGSWDGRFLPVNGDMRFPRRGAETVALNNGRIYIVGGQSATGGALSELEIYTPRGGRNARPSTRTDLESRQQSWAYGAPIVYRVTDEEGDDARVVVQWSDNGGATWNAAAPQDSTIGGDVAEATAPVTSGTTDNEGLAISPGAYPQSDHQYIWAMTRDIPRPPQGGSAGPYIFRSIPFGAVQGPAAQSVPVTVLYNTKVIPTILPLASRDGVEGAQQGGDIHIWVHFRDIDGDVVPGPGDAAQALFEYAIDANGDGSINDGLEFWNPMSVSGAAKYPANRQSNLLTGITTYSEPYQDSMPDIGDRPAELGWKMFAWDSVFDLGVPATSRGDVFVRVRPFDNLGPSPDEGFTATLYNQALQPESIRIIRDPAALWLDHFTPAGGNDLAVAVNEPLEFHFNGLVDPASVNEQTIQIRRNGTPILGVFTVDQDVDAHTTLVTFYPRLNSTVLDELVYNEQDNPTVLFPFSDYSIFIPGYHAGDDYPSAIPSVLPDLSVYGSEPDETFLLVQNVEINDSFRTGAGNYDDGQAPAVSAISPVPGMEVDDPTPEITLAYTGGLDLDTVTWPNIKITVDNSGGPSSARASNPVVPFQRTITNTQDPDTGLTTSVVTLTPLIQLPGGRTFNVITTSGLLGANGLPVESSNLTFTGSTDTGTRSVTGLEEFADNTYQDTTISDGAAWGTDLCNPGTLTGLQGGGTPPQGGADLTVADGQVATITNTVSDYGNITVMKGGTLRIRADAAATIRATGDIVIAGTVDFRGQGGWSKVAGNTQNSSYYYIGPRGKSPDMAGGEGYNGAGDGGNGTHNSGVNRYPGDNGTGSEYGQGGRVAGTATYYYYGAGGGAGAGHGAAGLPGGMAAAYTTSSSATSYGNYSVPGGTTGDPNMVTGPSAGSGGGGGGSSDYYPSQGTGGAWFHTGGGGGAGAGAVTFVCNGTFDLKASGYIDGRGGDGGGSVMYCGAGGGGSGGGLKVTSGVAANLNGIVDLRGGKGGPRSNGYGYSDSYNRYVAYFGSVRFGGDGGPGRFVVQAPNFSTKDDVRVKGQLLVQQISTLPTTSIAVSGVPSQFTNGGTLTYANNVTAVRYANLTVPAGKAVEIKGNSALRIYVDGTVDIQGTLTINGDHPEWGWNTSMTGGAIGYAPTRSLMNLASATTLRPSQYTGGVGNMGGGKGGDPYRRTGTGTRANAYLAQGTDGTGPAYGQNVICSNPGYSYGYSSGSYAYSYFYWTADGGGGGGGNATPGQEGWTTYSQGAYYTYSGGVDDLSTGEGHSEAKRKQYVDNGGGVLDASNISVTTLASFVGSGGGGGNAGAYIYSYQSGSYTYGYVYSGLAGGAGSGAGALALIAPNVSVSGTIEAKGGHGNLPGDAYYAYYAHSGGGAGSGGTVMLIGDTVNIAPVTNISDATSGATFDMTGGIGGGWRTWYLNSSTLSRHPHYNTMGNFGGDGGYGRLVVQYTQSLNNGASLFNRGGMEHVAFDDITQRYTVFSGSARAQCLGGSNGPNFQSTWYDLNSVAPVVNGLTVGTIGSNTNYTLQGEGAQSHPHNPGAGGTGEPDPSNKSGYQDPGTAFLDGWRWFRFGGTLNRASTDPTKPPPLLDDVRFPYVTDQVN